MFQIAFAHMQNILQTGLYVILLLLMTKVVDVSRWWPIKQKVGLGYETFKQFWSRSKALQIADKKIERQEFFNAFLPQRWWNTETGS